MNFDREAKRITKIFKKWRPILGLNEWDIKLHFIETIDEEDADLEAWATVSFEYIRADLHFCLLKTVLNNDEDLENLVVHEMCHVLLKEMQAWATCTCDVFDMRREERVATMFERALINARKAFKV